MAKTEKNEEPTKAKRAPAKKAEKKIEYDKSMTCVAGAALVDLTARLKKIMGEPENVNLTVNKSGVSVAASYSSGAIKLTNPDAVLNLVKKVSVTVPFASLLPAIKGRAYVGLSATDSSLEVSSTRFNCSLAILPVPEAVEEVSVTKGLESKPLQALLGEVGSLLTLNNVIHGTPLDLLASWGKHGIKAGVADNYHAIAVFNTEVKLKTEGEVSLPLAMASKLKEIGEQFSVSESAIKAADDHSFVQVQFTSSEGVAVPLNTIFSLLDSKSTWEVELDSKEFEDALYGVFAVAEYGKAISVQVKKDAMYFKGSSSSGKVKSGVQLGKSKGKAPDTFNINPFTLESILGKMSGKIKLSLCGNLMRVEPVTQSAWNVVGFISLSAGK
jgi:hypothetical protein